MKKFHLTNAPRGVLLRVLEVPEGKRRAQLIRLGIVIGEVLTCRERLPGGTVVVERKRQEIAIGASLAKEILVTATNHTERT